MRQHQGMPYGVTTPLEGVVATSSAISRFRRPTVLVTEDHSGMKDGHIAVVCRSNGVPRRPPAIPTVRGIGSAGELNAGDVVRIDPDGIITVTYEAGSRDNVLVLTGRCNARCIMCPQPPSAGNVYAPGVVTNFVRLMSPDTKCIGISGGEPTLARESFLEAIAACKRHLPRAELTILTNGISFSDFKYVKEVVSVGHPNVVFGIPLYSDVPALHDEIMGVEGFWRTLKGIQNLALFRQKVEIRTVIQRKNASRLPELAEFIYRNLPFSYHVALMGLEMMHNAERHAEDVWIDPAGYGPQMENAVRVLHRGALNVSIYNHPLCAIPKELWRFARASISGWKRIYADCCETCSVRAACGGLFSTSGNWRSRALSPVPRDGCSDDLVEEDLMRRWLVQAVLEAEGTSSGL